MVVRTSSERVDLSRKVVFEFLASSVDMSLVDDDIQSWMSEYGCDPERFGPPAPPVTDRDRRHAGHHHPPDGMAAETVHQPIKIDNQLYVRDYSRCILCYKCVEACGEDAQNTFAIGVAGRGSTPASRPSSTSA
jgi:NADP-reducing hydrogenase subunit HndD